MQCTLNMKPDMYYDRLFNGTSLPPGSKPMGFAIPSTPAGLRVAVQCAEKLGVKYTLTLGGPQVGGGGGVLPYSCSIGESTSSPLLVIELNLLARHNVNYAKP